MHDNIRRTIAAIIGVTGIAYISRLMAQGVAFVQPTYVADQTMIGVIICVLFLAFVLFLAVRPLAIKKMKWWVVGYSLVIVFFGHYLLISSIPNQMYASDIVILIGVVMFYLAISGILITKKAKKEIEEAMQEIIEV